MKARYYSVTLNCDIRGQHKVPGVCYRLTDTIRDCIEDMASKGTASLYDEEVRFVTGITYAVAHPRRRVERLPVKAATAPSPSVKSLPTSAAIQPENEFTGVLGVQGTPTILR